MSFFSNFDKNKKKALYLRCFIYETWFRILKKKQ